MAIAALGPLKQRGGVNAAELYKDAIGLYSQLTDEEKDILRHRHDQPDAKGAAALYAKIQPIMELMRRARRADYVDWGIGPVSFENGSIKGAQANGMQGLATLAAWEAGYRFQSDPDGAVSDLAAMEEMGRSGVDSLIGLLVEQGIHSLSVKVLAQNAGLINGAAAPDLADILSAATAEKSFQAGLNNEASAMQALVDAYADPATRSGSYIQRWAGAGSISAEELVSKMEWMVQTDQALATRLMEPDAQFQQWWTQKAAEAAAMPLVSVALPALEKVRTQSQALMAQNAMLDAGIALEQNDQTQFQSINDPASGKPFTYTQTANGFQLGSALQYHQKPVTLSFSTPAAK